MRSEDGRRKMRESKNKSLSSGSHCHENKSININIWTSCCSTWKQRRAGEDTGLLRVRQQGASWPTVEKVWMSTCECRVKGNWSRISGEDTAVFLAVFGQGMKGESTAPPTWNWQTHLSWAPSSLQTPPYRQVASSHTLRSLFFSERSGTQRRKKSQN